MHTITTEEQLVEARQRIKREAAGFTTSFFAHGDLVRAWIRRGTLSYVETPGSLLLFRRDRDFFHVYHTASDSEALAAALDGISPCRATLCADLVGRPDEAAALSSLYRAYGFEEHTSLIRMTRLLDPVGPEEYADPDVVFAGMGDAAAILQFLERLLDRFAEQIPEQEEIEAAIAHRNILLVRGSEDFGGLLFFETFGLTSVLRYWHVNAGCRERGIGRRLIRRYFDLCRARRRIILWVISSNDAAIAKYRHYGFRDEGLVDRIMIRRG